LKTFSASKKNVKFFNKNNDQVSSAKILINQIRDIQISKDQKTIQKKQEIIHQMKNKRLLK
jgi:hypothetical protein